MHNSLPNDSRKCTDDIESKVKISFELITALQEIHSFRLNCEFIAIHSFNSCSSTHSHPFQVSLPNPQILSHKSSVILRKWNSWDVLPSPCFPESYNLPSFKCKINKLDLISSILLAFHFLLSSYIGALYRPPWHSLNITHSILQLALFQI